MTDEEKRVLKNVLFESCKLGMIDHKMHIKIFYSLKLGKRMLKEGSEFE